MPWLTPPWKPGVQVRLREEEVRLDTEQLFTLPGRPAGTTVNTHGSTCTDI